MCPVEDAADDRTRLDARTTDHHADTQPLSGAHCHYIARRSPGCLLVGRIDVHGSRTANVGAGAGASDDFREIEGARRVQVERSIVGDEAVEIGGGVQFKSGSAVDGGVAGVADVAKAQDLRARAPDNQIQHTAAVVVGTVAQVAVEALCASGVERERAVKGIGLSFSVFHHAAGGVV